MMHTVYAGEQVRLRPFRDAEELYSLSAHANSEAHAALGPLWYTRAFEEHVMEADGLLDPARVCGFAIEDLDSGRLAGIETAVLDGPAAYSAELGTTLLPEFRGRGLAVEAKQLMLCFLFESFPLERVAAFTMGNNRSARRSLELCGMHREGVLRSSFFSQGRYVDRVYYAIFREEWEQLPLRGTVQRGQLVSKRQRRIGAEVKYGIR